MKLNKINIFYENNNYKSVLICKYLKKIIKKNNFYYQNLNIVIGGDGFMLSIIKKNKNFENLFYGINSGNYGFLMNKFSYKNILINIKKSKKISISPLKMIVKKKDDTIKKGIAINEVSILRQSKQAATISVKKNLKFIIKKLVGDGLLVSTPAGSTAYNLSVHGPILDLNSKKIAISPISPFRPRRWKGRVVGDRSIIKVKNLDIKKRPISITADNYQIKNIKEATIIMFNKIKINLLYDFNSSLQKKIKLEQIRKEVN